MLTLVLVAVSAFARVPTAAGEIVITEVMPAPLSPAAEWFEVYNASASDLELDGCRVMEGHLVDGVWSGHSHTVTALTVPMGGYALLYKYVQAEDLEAGACAAYEGAAITSTCLANIDYVYVSLGFNNADAETVCVVCGGDGENQTNRCDEMGPGETLIDAAPVDWPAFDDDCQWGNNCSISLGLSDSNATANDNNASWCVGQTSYFNTALDAAWGTPGAANPVCTPPDGGGDSGGGDSGGGDSGGGDSHCGDNSGEPLGKMCTVGQAIFTEIMPAPRDLSSTGRVNGYDEWLELWGVDTELSGTCSLSGCTLTRSELDGTSKEIILGHVGVTGGEHTIIARSLTADVASGICFKSGDERTVNTADFLYGYGDFTLPNDGEVSLTLTCGGDEVDRTSYNWDDFSGTCTHIDANRHQEGCSVNLGRQAYSAASNDLASNWCVAQMPKKNPRKNIWTRYDSSETAWTLLGTPGEDGDCEHFTRACEGELVFTEIMAVGAGVSDWVEVYNTTSGDLELSGCRIERYRLTDGVEDSLQDYTFGELGESPVVLAQRPLAISFDGCIDPEDDPTDGCTFGETVADDILLTADNTEYLRLICPPNPDCGGADDEEILVDGTHFSMDAQLVDKGHSLMFDPRLYTDTDPATANDDTANWCEGAWSQPFIELDAENCNFGTPGGDDDGGPGECRTDTIDIGSSGPACRCQSGGPALVGWLFGALALVGRRRRAR